MMDKQNQQPKGIPYGMQNWLDVRLDNYYYVDKTQYIARIERANRFFFFIRPRRFGKSLMLNMLRQYYDVKQRDKFDRLFGDLWIGSHPTVKRNSFLVLPLNFSAFSGDFDGYKERMDDYCCLQYESFIRKYSDMLPDNAMDLLHSRKGAANQLTALADVCNAAGQKIYLFIDEYDHFTNVILAEPDTEAAYKAETHGTGTYRGFFNAVKTASDTAIERLFITGVSPVTMDDLTSGFNIGTNYSTHSDFNGMIGFTEQEVRQMIDYYRQYYTFNHTTDELIGIMKPWYDNYCFSEECLADPPMYNSDMVLYFMYSYIDRKGNIPKQMLDLNIRTDYNKLRMLIRKDSGFEDAASAIQNIVEKGEVTAEVKESFTAEGITNPDNFVSLLFYFGMLTIAGTDGLDGLRLCIPNQVVREQMYGYLLSAYRENQLYIDEKLHNRLIADMALRGEWLPFFRHVSDTLKQYASQRDKQKGESFVHGFTLAHTCLNKAYLPISELDTGIRTDIDGNAVGGYADIYLQPMLEIYPDIEHSYVIELKYLSSKATDAEVKAAKEKAREQLLRYAAGMNIERTKGSTTLHRLILLWRGMELAVAEEI